MTTTRRQFLIGAGVVAGSAAAAGALGRPLAEAARGDDMEKSLPVDRVVRTTCSPNCTGSCGQLAFVRDGNVVKVQQAADYPENEYNPRGCMKGISYHLLIHGPDRILKPLVRTGERGSGEFREASWDEVLDRISGELKRIGDRWGWDSVHVFSQVPGSGYVQKGAAYRACAALGMTHGTSFDFNGDLPMGMPITFGVQNAEHESKDWANSRFILLIGANPLETRIPDVHFIHDAVEKGARLVVVDPTFSSTASKADAHIRIKPGTDAAFGLALCRQVLVDGKADWDFMRTFTDAPLLVRRDTGRRLRAEELVRGEARDPGPAAGVGLGEYGAKAPPVGVAPEVKYSEKLPHGVPPLPKDHYVVWDAVKGEAVVVGTERLGIPAGVDAALDGEYTVRLADGSSVTVTPGFALVRAEVDAWTPERAEQVTGVPADEIVRVARGYAAERPAAVIMGGGSNHWFHGDLTGRAFALLASLTGNVGRSGGGFSVYVGQYKVRVDTSPWWSLGDVKAPIVPSIYFVRGRTETMNEAIPYPKSGFKALICTFANMFLQAMDVNRLHKTLDGCELVVVVDHQMTDTAKWADIVLPAATWYEKSDLTATPLHPYLQIQQEAIPPRGESKPELWMWQELMRRIDPQAFEEYFDMTAEEAIEAILAQGGFAEGITLEQLQAGPVRLKVPDPDVAFVRQVEELAPFPPPSLPAPIEADRRLHPDAAGGVLQGGGPLPGARRSGPHVQAAARRRGARPGRVPHRAALAALQVAHPLELRQRGLAQRDHRRPGARAAQPGHRGRARHRGGRPGGAAQHPGRRPRLGAPHAGRPARHRHPLRGLVEPAARRRQERQRAHLVRGEPHPRDPQRGQHVGALHRLEGLPLRGHASRRRHRRRDGRRGLRRARR